MLFSPLQIGGQLAANRIMVSPMCTYSAVDGRVADYHLVHLGRFALGGAGIVFAEATAVAPEGRISHHDLGLWRDDQIPGFQPVTRLLAEYGAIPGIQLAHAGRKASAHTPWHGGGALADGDAVAGSPPWPVVGPSAVAAGPGWPVPHEMTLREIDRSIDDWANAARRASEAGFRAIELHGAHGYLLHAFQSPVSNHRTDAFGGDATRRMRYPLEVARAIRSVVPPDTALFYRLSVVDGVPGGLDVADSISFARALQAVGIDVIDCSSGGIVTDRGSDTRIRRSYGFHTPYSAALKRELDLPVTTVGLIVDPDQAEAILRRGDADVVALGREMLSNPHWAHHARTQLASPDWSAWHRQARGFLELRDQTMRALDRAGATPTEP